MSTESASGSFLICSFKILLLRAKRREQTFSFANGRRLLLGDKMARIQRLGRRRRTKLASLVALRKRGAIGLNMALRLTPSILQQPAEPNPTAPNSTRNQVSRVDLVRPVKRKPVVRVIQSPVPQRSTFHAAVHKRYVHQPVVPTAYPNGMLTKRFINRKIKRRDAVLQSSLLDRHRTIPLGSLLTNHPARLQD